MCIAIQVPLVWYVIAYPRAPPCHQSSLIGGNLVNFVGTLLLAYARSFEVMFLGRFIMGLGAGIAFMGPELYASEVRTAGITTAVTWVLPGAPPGPLIMAHHPQCMQISPPHVRGLTSTWGELFINTGILVGYVSGYPPPPPSANPSPTTNTTLCRHPSQDACRTLPPRPR